MYVTGTHALLICTAALWEAGTMVITNGYDAKLCLGCVPIGTVTLPYLSLHFRVSLVCTWCLMGLADHTAAESELLASFTWYVNIIALHSALSPARLRHTGAHALATRGRASPVQANYWR